MKRIAGSERATISALRMNSRVNTLYQTIEGTLCIIRWCIAISCHTTSLRRQAGAAIKVAIENASLAITISNLSMLSLMYL